MQPRLTYFVSSVLNLSLEDFHNAGLTPEETKAEIEKIRDPGSCGGYNLYCKESGINRNWNVSTQLTNSLDIMDLIDTIHSRLTLLLEAKKAKCKVAQD